MYSSRGPEYRLLKRKITVPAEGRGEDRACKLERWVDPTDYGLLQRRPPHPRGRLRPLHQPDRRRACPSDMFLQVKGEGLNVGCVLTWGPCFDFQRQFFRAEADKLSEPFTRAEVRRGGERLRLAGARPRLPAQPPRPDVPRLRTAPAKGWPTWTTPVLRWAKDQGAVTGYAHSASGLQINPAAAAKRLLAALRRGQATAS